jgi:hypothetical protein
MTAFEMRPGSRGGFEILIGGTNFADTVAGVEFGAYADARVIDSRQFLPLLPEVTLTLRFTETVIDLPDTTRVRVDPTTHRLLERLGWKPPKETK